MSFILSYDAPATRTILMSKNEGSCFQLFYDISYDVQKPEVEKKERQITVKKKIYYQRFILEGLLKDFNVEDEVAQ